MTEEEKKERARQYARDWYARNKEKVKEAAKKWSTENKGRRKEIQRKSDAKRADSVAITRKAWWERNPEKRAEYANRLDRELEKIRSAEYREKNPEKRKAATAAYREKNRESLREYNRLYSKENPEKELLRAAIRRARIRGVGGELSKNIRSILFSEQGGKCCYCFRGIRSRSEQHLDHFHPISRGGRNIDSNMVLACAPCNHRKSAKDPYDFMREMGLMTECEIA